MVVESKKFSVGDKVISTRDTAYIPEGFIGHIVEIEHLGGKNYSYTVEGGNGECGEFSTHELNLLGSAVDVKSTSALDKQVSGNHYKDCGIQPIEYIHANNLNYFEGNAVKYITRHRKKNGKADIEKAIHYLELMLELEYKDETI